MTEPRPDSELTPAQTDAVRRLLADARHREPVPSDVAARLDAALAELTSTRSAAASQAANRDQGHVGAGPTESRVAESQTAEPRPAEPRTDAGPVTAPVIDLAARRRRRGATLLVAAAAVVALGVGLPPLLTDSDDATTTAEGGAGDQSKDQSTASQPDAGTSAPSASAPADTRVEADDDRYGKPQTESGLLSQRVSAGEPVVLTSSQPLRRQLLGVRLESSALSTYADPKCRVPARARDRVVAATYDGRPAALVAGPPDARGDLTIGAGWFAGRPVAVYLCGESDPIATTR